MRYESNAAGAAERDPAYEAFVKAKVDGARAQIAQGKYVANEAVKAEFSARREAVRRLIRFSPT